MRVRDGFSMSERESMEFSYTITSLIFSYIFSHSVIADDIAIYNIYIYMILNRQISLLRY